jgi:hypothetical protein
VEPGVVGAEGPLDHRWRRFCGRSIVQ